MTNAIATVSLSGTLEEKLRAAAAAGYAGVEIFDTDFLASAMTPREVRALLDEGDDGAIVRPNTSSAPASYVHFGICNVPTQQRRCLAHRSTFDSFSHAVTSRPSISSSINSMLHLQPDFSKVVQVSRPSYHFQIT